MTKIDQWQMDAIKNAKSNRARRRFACAMVRWALSQPVNVDPKILEALQVAERLADGSVDKDELETTRKAISELADHYGRLDLDEQDRSEQIEGYETDPNIWDQARICYATMFCLRKSARDAAINAAYEVEFAIRLDGITEVDVERKKREIAEILQNG